jgi:hypothetical protein
LLPSLYIYTNLYAAQSLPIADGYFQSRYEKEFEGVQDVFELQVLSPVQSPVWSHPVLTEMFYSVT